jgi:hypothetical protein
VEVERWPAKQGNHDTKKEVVLRNGLHHLLGTILLSHFNLTTTLPHSEGSSDSRKRPGE